MCERDKLIVQTKKSIKVAETESNTSINRINMNGLDSIKNKIGQILHLKT